MSFRKWSFLLFFVTLWLPKAFEQCIEEFQLKKLFSQVKYYFGDRYAENIAAIMEEFSLLWGKFLCGIEIPNRLEQVQDSLDLNLIISISGEYMPSILEVRFLNKVLQ